jgi:hypothetical protein
MNDLLLQYQQELSGLSGAEILDFVRQTGLEFPSIETLMATRGEQLIAFTNAFSEIGARGVPHIRINGEQFNPGELPWPGASLVDAATSAIAR